MKTSSTIGTMGICATMFTAGLLAACGGGSAASDAVGPTATGSSSSVGSSETAGTAADAPAQDVTVAAPINTALSASQFAETLASISDTKTISVALMTGGTTAPGADSLAPASAVDESAAVADSTVVVVSDANAVSTLSILPNLPRFAKVAEEGHVFTVPTKTLVRYGDPVSNKWLTKTLSGYGECSNQYFGNDPAYMVVKVCQAFGTPVAITGLPSAKVLSQPAGKMPVVDLSKITTPWIGYNTLMVQPTNEIAPNSDIGAFRVSCGVAKLSFDDPIVYPGQAGKSHLHTFFGNTGVSANSTPDSIRNTGSSTCHGGIANRSAYWVPSMIDIRTGTPVIPQGNSVYYKTGYDLPPTTVLRPIPVGLRMIAGNPAGMVAGSQGTRFMCAGGPNDENDKYGSEIANCDVGASLVQNIMFPQCWDGVNLDSPDHKSHMAYPNNNACPASHPVAIPSITFNIGYTVAKKDDPLYWRLSSDNYDAKLPGGYSSHGDWFNGWKNDVSDSWGKNCVMALKDCHSHLVGDGRMIY